MQSTIHIAALAAGVVFAVIGMRRGLYAMWAMMFNIMVAIYLGIMLTPTLSSWFNLLGEDFGNSSKGSFWYLYAAVVAGVAFVSFVVLEVAAVTYITGTFEISLPKMLNKAGAALAGFICGYTLWGFLCFVVLIMPFSNSRLILDAFTGDKAARVQSKQVGAPAVAKVVNTINAFSLQPDFKKVRQIISWTLDLDSIDNPKPQKIDNSDDNVDTPAESQVSG